MSRLGSYLRILSAPVAVLGVAVAIIWPRFAVSGPSLIDDWDALLSAPATMHQIVRLHYPPGQRFFPTWILWNWLQWRVPGAPEHMLGPNLMDVARVALLVGGLTALTWILLPGRAGRPVERLVLAVLPALVIVTVPAFAQDLARFGPEEPALVGGLMLGAALLVWGGRRLARGDGRSNAAAWFLVVPGWVLWCYGAGQKETSVCVLLLLGLAIPYGRLVRRAWSPRQLRVLVGLAAAALVPIAVVFYEVVAILRRGTLVYGAHVKTGSGSVSVFTHAFRVMHASTQSYAGFVLLALVLLGLARSVRPLRVDWAQVAILVLGLASLEMSVQTDVYESRYYLPTIALWAVGAARTVARVPAPARTVALLAATALCAASAVPAHRMVRTWAAGDQQGDDLVRAVREHTHGGCHLTISGVDYERTRSIAALVSYPDGPGSCAGLPRYELLNVSPESEAHPLCRSADAVGSWNVSNLELIKLVRCRPS